MLGCGVVMGAHPLVNSLDYHAGSAGVRPSAAPGGGIIAMGRGEGNGPSGSKRVQTEIWIAIGEWLETSQVMYSWPGTTWPDLYLAALLHY